MFGLALALSVLIGVSLGLLGGGGSILTTPILIYVLGVPAKPAIATSLLVVSITSIAGMFQHARAGNVVWKTGFAFGAAGMAGAYLGGMATRWIPETVLLSMFALMMLATSIAMFRGRRTPSGAVEGQEQPLLRVIVQGALVGTVTGLLGAGGGFLVVPALALLGGLPMQKAVGTSLFVIAMNTASGFAGHIQHTAIDLPLALGMSAASVAGSFIGSAVGKQVKPESLRRGFAVFVLVMGCFVLYQQL